MATACLAALWSLLAACGAGQWVEETDELYDVGPYVLLSGPSELIVAIDADLLDPPLVEWHVAAGGSITTGGEVARREDDRWVARLPPVAANAPVQYRVRSERGVGPWHVTRVGRARGEPFRIALYGGTHDNLTIHRGIVGELARQQVDLAVHTGQAVATDTPEAWAEFFTTESALLAQAPLLLAPGPAAAGGHRYVRHYLRLPDRAEPATHFYRDWGDLRIVALAPDVNCAIDRGQRYRAAGALAQARREDMLSLLLVHTPLYAASDDECARRLLATVRSLAAAHGVELVVSGSNHGYERWRLDDAVYISTGTAGSHPRARTTAPASIAYAAVPHYVLVDVSAQSLTVRAIDARGQALDWTTVAAR